MRDHSSNGKLSSAGTRPVRVAIIASSLRMGGAEKQTVYMARALLEAGIDVRFFYLGEGGHYESVLRQGGVPERQIHIPHRPLVMLARLIGELSQWRPQIVLAAQFSDLQYGAVAGRFCHALILGGIRSDGLYELNAHGHHSRWMIGLAHGLVANSWRARQNLVGRGVSAPKIEVLPNVIDLRDFDARSALAPEVALPSDRVLVAAVGSLHECKRFDRFLDALALARRSEAALAGVIAGADCGVKRELEARAKGLGLAPGDLVFLGEVNRVPALLAQSAMLILTSDYEGFPNVILEAMAARLPVISTPAGDAGLIVQHGITGYAVDAEDIRSMAAFMVQLARSPATRKNFGEAGRQRVEQEYSHHSLADRLLAIFVGFADRARRHSLSQMLRRNVLPKMTEALPADLLLERPAA
ncbi:MAG TPA: glycosyltransferase [Candidatus Cybelea sp.]|nr:glycosyltransferase [Candidatus Cybelea sp.]